MCTISRKPRSPEPFLFRTNRTGLNAPLGNHDNSADLAEVFVESEGGLNPEPLHDDPAHAVRKTPRLILMFSEQFPGPQHISAQDPFNLDNLFAEKSRP